MTVRELIDRMASLQPQSVFLISPKDGQVLTFAKLQEESRAISARLRQLGLESGDKIAFLLDNGIFTAELFLGVMYGGFVIVPLNIRAGVSQLSYTVEHCDARVIYVAEEYRALAEEVTASVLRSVRIIPVDCSETAKSSEPATARIELGVPAPEDAALLMYTSGSTGQPKAAVHSHRSLLAASENVVCAHRLSPTDRALLVLPLYHMNGGAVTLVPTLLSGGSVVVPDRFSVSQFWDLLEQHRCTWSAVVPTIISQLLDWQDPLAASREELFGRIRFLRSSSAPLSQSLQREFLAKFGVLLIQAMGSSEAGNVFSNPLPPEENRIGSPGLPTGFEVKIVDRDGREAPVGEPGEVIIRGSALTLGYYKDPEATAAVFDADGWFRTGDLAYRDERGYFFVVGRSKELIIKGGVNIAPRQIDEVLESHPAVLEAAAVGVADRYLGEDLVAFVVLRTGTQTEEKDLLAFCEDRLGHFKTPTRIYFAEGLPKGPSGKVQRLQLLEKAARLAADSGVARGSEPVTVNENNQPVPDGSPVAIEQIIAESWAEVLSQPSVGYDSNFFALGGHSLLAVQCVSLLRERIPVALSLSDFFEYATISRQAVLVRDRWPSAASRSSEAFGNRTGEAPVQFMGAPQPPGLSAIPQRNRARPAPLSPGQRRLWFLDRLNAGLAAYNESDAYRLVGEVNFDALERALNVIVERHEVLRSTIQIVDGEPAAFVHNSWPIRIGRTDLTTLEESARREAVERLLVEEPAKPYHLETEPGIRVLLLHLRPQEHILILMMHHIIADWSSEGILWRELSSLYRSFASGEAPALPPLPIQHGDYAVWQAQQNSETNFDDDLAYWEENLRGAPLLLDLPTDRTRPPNQSYRGARRRIFLTSGVTEALRRLGKATETTLFTVFATTLNVLFHRYTGACDISLGVPVAERDRKELQSVIGFLLQTHVLRTRLSEDMTFRQLLATVHKGVLGLYVHRSVPFDKVVSRLRPERSLSYSPLFQVMLIGRDPDQMLSFVGIEGLTVEPVYPAITPSKFDLTLFVTDCDDNIWLEMEYSTDLFDGDRIERMLGHYRTLLESAAANPGQRLSELPLLTPAERQQLLVDWNATETDYRAEAGIHELFETQAKKTPGAIAAEFNGQRLTYAELNHRSSEFAQYLRTLGVGPGHLAAVYIERSLEMAIALLGILKTGAAYLPLDLGFPPDRLAFMLADAKPRVVVTQTSLSAKLPQRDASVVCIDDFTVPIEAPIVETGSGSLAYVIYTSGSTGRPKGVEVSHRSVVNFLHGMWLSPGMDARDTMLSVTTLSFDIFGLEMWLPLTTGARVVIAPQSVARDGRALSQAIRSSEATVMQATPSTWRLLLEAGWTGAPQLKVLCGGEAWTSELAEQLLPKCAALWNMYGPTETTVWSAVARVEQGKPVVIGRPIANTRFYVVDTNLQPVPVGVPGELLIGGDGVARGYLNRPELTAEKFIADGFYNGESQLYRTGDLVRWTSEGQMEFLGRLDHQVKIRGFRIELGEIEGTLRTYLGVREAAVVVQGEDPPKLVAFVVLAEEPACAVAELREFLKQKLPDYMIPAAFVTLPSLPFTPNGKLDRKALPLHSAEEDKRTVDHVSPEGETERKIGEVWQEVLAIPSIGRSDNFFDLGGDSLRLLKVNRRLREAFNRDIPMVDMFRFTTVRALANHLANHPDSTTASSASYAPEDLRRESVRRRRQLRLRVTNEMVESSERGPGL